jgi:alkanesulfonate monooxygenase SsuD/methylene tetrahydromethanopterin reductase-like flavin-dependent oxidoreductase (luciferase family)
MMPKPVQQPHPPIIVGGTGERTMRVAAKHATDYNQIAPLEDVKANLAKMEAICGEMGRDFGQMRHSVQLQIKLSDSKEEMDQILARGALLARRPSKLYDDPEKQTRDSMLLGSVTEVKEQVDRWTDAGINHIILMTPRPFDRSMMERFASEVAPSFA